jgi:hypothetical protein
LLAFDIAQRRKKAPADVVHAAGAETVEETTSSHVLEQLAKAIRGAKIGDDEPEKGRCELALLDVFDRKQSVEVRACCEEPLAECNRQRHQAVLKARIRRFDERDLARGKPRLVTNNVRSHLQV